MRAKTTNHYITPGDRVGAHGERTVVCIGVLLLSHSWTALCAFVCFLLQQVLLQPLLVPKELFTLPF